MSLASTVKHYFAAKARGLICEGVARKGTTPLNGPDPSRVELLAIHVDAMPVYRTEWSAEHVEEYGTWESFRDAVLWLLDSGEDIFLEGGSLMGDGARPQRGAPVALPFNDKEAA